VLLFFLNKTMNYKKALASVALVPLMGTTFAAEDMMMETTSMMESETTMQEDSMMEKDEMMQSNMNMDYDVSTMMGLHIVAANYLAEQNVIVDNSADVDAYNFTNNITRREMVKVAMNISGQTVVDSCNGEFSDLNSDDFGCKYAEAALANGFIAANASFRPDDLITNAESLKMIMQAKGISRDENDDWRAGYASKAMSYGIVQSEFEFDANAKRGWIFDVAALAYPDFKAQIQAEVSVGVEVGGAMMLPGLDIVDNAVKADNVTTLVAAVTAAGLVDTLKSEGPFTVFAPTNDAFANLPAGTVDTLLMEENKGALSDILTYHVVAGSYTSADLTDGLMLTTVQGQNLMFTVVDGVLMINGSAMVETADVISSNGVTHVIDRVLTPEAGVEVGGAMMLPSMNIVENAMNADNVTTLVAAVAAADLVDTLKSEGPFTVFAPTNDAFAKLPDGTVDSLLMVENKAALADILTYHVVAGSYTSADLTDGLELTTVQGEKLMFTLNTDGMLEINGSAMVETADVISSNGVTHVIDTVLMPAE
jgi:transforming growth factor-beta-induced protein